ncbi:MAG: sigma-54 dependent transcriptional regulator [Prevotellaceae bacterium]|jgi:two-component system response regulator HydG|nr:sigma-54 dependent transcriptional regulator [Prevotellaceae bacterium]
MSSILIVEDDLTLCLMLKTWLTRKRFSVDSANSIREAKKKIKKEIPDIILSDLRLPDGNGIELLRWAKEFSEPVIVIMMTSYANIGTAVESIKSGAYDYVAKPLNPEELYSKICAAQEQNKETPASARTNAGSHALNSENPDDLQTTRTYIKGHSPLYKQLYEYVDLVAPTKMSVLILGASGVGKEHIARRIHEKSERVASPFVAVDCGVLSRELAASDFFGHEKGAFTGALTKKQGLFVAADGGTIFLDEIGNLSLDIQIQLLRVLQEKRVRPVGSEKDVPVNVRIIAATNEKIDTAAPNPSFRLDLYHRLSEFVLYVPSLNECKEDIPLFLHHFLERSNGELGKNIIGFTPQALNLLINYSWPGNIREIKNVVSRMVLISQEQYIKPEHVPEYIRA